jgi:hypothetical protein
VGPAAPPLTQPASEAMMTPCNDTLCDAR